MGASGFGVAFDCCRQRMKTVDLEKRDRSARLADDRLDDRVARAQATMQHYQIGLRLNDDAAPSSFVEPEGRATCNRMPAADVDIGPLRLTGERQMEMIVLHVLRIGQWL